jgi:hypothetical protein
MTVESCAAFCDDYAWFGVEYGSQCYCGPYPNAGSGLTPVQSDCDMTCSGNAGEFCGAGNRLNTYFSSDSSKASTDPSSPAVVGNYNYTGCIVDSPRMLSTLLAAEDSMTVEICLNLAQSSGYLHAGLEYARECWAGNSYLSTFTSAATTDCSMPCLGNAAELCGGSSRLSLYTLI